jgi:integrase
MGRASKNADISSKNARKALTIQREPYWFAIGAGQHLGYRKTDKAKGSWIVRYYDKEYGRRFESLGVADDSVTGMGSNELTFQQAINAARAEIANMKRADTAGVERVTSYTVAQALDDYVAEKEREKRKPLPLTALGKIQLDKLTHGKVKAWRDALAESAPRQRTGFVMEKVIVKTLVRGEYKDRLKERATSTLKPQAFRAVDANDPDALRRRQATANRILTVLKAALNLAHEERKVSSKAAWEAVKPFRKVDVPKIRFMEDAEVTALVKACDPDFQLLVKGALVTGCRYGELTAMTVKDFDEAKATVYVAKSKNGESRYIDLNDEGVAFFAELTAKRGNPETIFQKANGTAWNKSEQKRPMDAACEASKVEGVTFHILRHTYASHAVMNGMPIAVLSQHLGHKDTRITERHYAHLSESYRRTMVRANAPSFGFGASKPGPVLVSKVG